MRRRQRKSSPISGAHFRNHAWLRELSSSSRFPSTLPDHRRVGENQPQRHHQDTADPKSKRSAEYRRECVGTVGTLPVRRMGQAKAECLPPATVPNASSLTESRSMDLSPLPNDLPGGIGLRVSWCFKTSDRAEKEYGGAAVDKSTYSLPVASLRKAESRRPRVRADVRLFSAENAPARPSTNHRSIVYGKAGERNDPNQKRSDHIRKARRD